MNVMMVSGGSGAVVMGVILIGRFDSILTLILGALCIAVGVPFIAAACQFGDS